MTIFCFRKYDVQLTPFVCLSVVPKPSAYVSTIWTDFSAQYMYLLSVISYIWALCCFENFYQQKILFSYLWTVQYETLCTVILGSRFKVIWMDWLLLIMIMLCIYTATSHLSICDKAPCTCMIKKYRYLI